MRHFPVTLARPARLVLGLAVVMLLLPGTPVAAQRPTFALAKPHPYGRQSDAGNKFIQIAAHSKDTATTLNGAETKVRHEAGIAGPGDSAASYSYSVGAYTTTGYWLQMGYLVLGSDSPGLARWFVQVLDCRSPMPAVCKTVEWKMSRAGEANPPPACAACSGDAGHGGYPFAFTSDAGGTWTFWFDGIKKDIVSLGAAHNAVDPGRVYFLGEVTHPTNPAAFSMRPRSTVRTLRLWSSAAGRWTEPSSAVTAYATEASQTPTCPTNAGIEPLGRAVDTYLNTSFYQVRAGTGVACPTPGTPLWG